MTTRSPSGRYTRGVVRFWPDLAPVVVSTIIGAPAKSPPTLPWLARNSLTIVALKSLMPSLWLAPPQTKPTRRLRSRRRRRTRPEATPPGGDRRPGGQSAPPAGVYSRLNAGRGLAGSTLARCRGALARGRRLAGPADGFLHFRRGVGCDRRRLQR